MKINCFVWGHAVQDWGLRYDKKENRTIVDPLYKGGEKIKPNLEIITYIESIARSKKKKINLKPAKDGSYNIIGKILSGCILNSNSWVKLLIDIGIPIEVAICLKPKTNKSKKFTFRKNDFIFIKKGVIQLRWDFQGQPNFFYKKSDATVKKVKTQKNYDTWLELECKPLSIKQIRFSKSPFLYKKYERRYEFEKFIDKNSKEFTVNFSPKKS